MAEAALTVPQITGQTDPSQPFYQRFANDPWSWLTGAATIGSQFAGPAGYAINPTLGFGRGIYEGIQGEQVSSDTPSSASTWDQIVSTLLGGTGALGHDAGNWLAGLFGPGAGGLRDLSGAGKVGGFAPSLAQQLGLTTNPGGTTGFGVAPLASNANPNQGFGVPPLASSANPSTTGFGVPPLASSINPGQGSSIGFGVPPLSSWGTGVDTSGVAPTGAGNSFGSSGGSSSLPSASSGFSPFGISIPLLGGQVSQAGKAG